MRNQSSDMNILPVTGQALFLTDAPTILFLTIVTVTLSIIFLDKRLQITAPEEVLNLYFSREAPPPRANLIDTLNSAKLIVLREN